MFLQHSPIDTHFFKICLRGAQFSEVSFVDRTCWLSHLLLMSPYSLCFSFQLHISNFTCSFCSIASFIQAIVHNVRRGNFRQDRTGIAKARHTLRTRTRHTYIIVARPHTSQMSCFSNKRILQPFSFLFSQRIFFKILAVSCGRAQPMAPNHLHTQEQDSRFFITPL